MAARQVLNANLSGQDRGHIFGPQLGPDEIRVLDINPSSVGDSGVACQLSASKLHGRPYVAISYNWGPLDNPPSILLNNTLYGVDVWYELPARALDLIQLLQHPSTNHGTVDQSKPADLLQGRPIWLDCVTINQRDDVERASQMRLMESVYEQAACTLLCLGRPSSGRNEDAVLALEWLGSLNPETRDLFTALPKEVQLQRWRPRAWAAVCDMIEKIPWWRRRWCMQEAVVSKDVWMIYGMEVLKWDVFEEAFWRAAYMWSGLTQQPNFQLHSEGVPMCDTAPAFAITNLRFRRQRGEAPPKLLETLLKFRRCDCMEATDRLFALLGLCSPAERTMNQVDLKLGPLIVFKKFVLSYIELYQSLDILCACLEIAAVQRPEVPAEIDGLIVQPDPPGVSRLVFLPDLPSWAPNFTSHRVEWQLGPSPETNAAFDPVFDASRGCPNRLPNTRNIDKVLPVVGVEIDRIQAFRLDSLVSQQQSATGSSPHWWALWYWFIAGSVIPNHLYQTQEERWLAFLRTITAGGRCLDTDRILSDAYVKHWGSSFFENTLLGQFWHDSQGLRGTLPAQEADYYSARWADAPKGYTPGVMRNTVCFLKMIKGVSGRIGLAPPRTQVGDRIVIIFGCSSPLLLVDVPGRPGHHRIRGEVYMDGFMFGEAVQLWKQGHLQASNYNLV